MQQDATTGTPVGTPAYLAPEQLTTLGHASEKTDLYAMGLVLYEAVTGRPPVQTDTFAQLVAERTQSKPTSPSKIAPEVDPELQEIIMQLLAVDPEARPASD